MKNKLIYLAATIILTLGCWLSAIFFGGVMNVGTFLALSALVVLIALSLVPVILRMNHKVWIYGGLFTLFVLFVLFLPASVVVRIFPYHEGQPFGTSIAFVLLLIISISLVIVALLINSGLRRYQKTHGTSGEGETNPPDYFRKIDKTTLIILSISMILLAKALYSFYWFMIWDSTYDALDAFWLPVPILAVIFAGFLLFFILPGKARPAGFLYFLLIPVLLSVFTLAKQVDFRQLTDKRAEEVSQLIEAYYAKVGRYPEDLGQLFPWYMIPIPEPIILYGESWCYDGGEDYYRLGYINRDHWSSPNLFGQLSKTKGDIADLPPLCKEEAAALLDRYPDAYWIFDDSERTTLP